MKPSYISTVQQHNIGNLQEVIKDTPDIFVKSVLKTIYPRRIIKRFIVKPWLGRWYYYMDTYSKHYSQQLTFFYGKMDIYLSPERYCVLCAQKLRSQKENSNNFPIALCDKCQPKIYHNYLQCQKSVFFRGFDRHFSKLKLSTHAHSSNDKGKRTIDRRQLCENLLEPRCNFPITLDNTTPCLKNHAIGISIIDLTHIKIFIGTQTKLKYRMIWEGGLMGIILGKKHQILNLERLNSKIQKIFKYIRKALKILKNPQQNNKYKKEISVIPPQAYIHNEQTTLSLWLMVTYLSYYNQEHIHNLFNLLISKPLKILDVVAKQLLKKCKLEILEFVDLFKYFPPLSSEFRRYLNSLLKTRLIPRANPNKNNQQKSNNRRGIGTNNQSKMMNSDQKLKKVLQNMSKSNPRRLLEIMSKEFKKIHLISNKAFQTPLQIYRVLGSFGPYVVAKTNKSSQPIMLKINDLIGRELI